jgi:uncharacterized protein (DUF302 family)
MTNHAKKIIVHASFKTLIDQLIAELQNCDFIVFGPMRIQKELQNVETTQSRYEVILVELPRLSSKMITAAPNEGAILPICISVIELYPGEIELVITNPTELLASANNNLQLFSLAREVRQVLDQVIQKFESDPDWTPDLVTSWG